MKQTEFIAYVTQLIGEFGYLLPEMTLIVGSLVVILFDLIYKGQQGQIVKTALTLMVLVLAACAVATITVDGSFLNGVLAQSALIRNLKWFFILMTALVLLFPNSKIQSSKGEYHYLILMVLLGAMFLIQVQNLLLFYVSLELVSITSYVLIAFSFHRKGFEAGIKYLLFGAMSSGLLLYGLSLMYGLTGSLDIQQLSELVMLDYDTTWLNMALLLFFVGVFFKLALIPFHIWSPDAYEAGPTAAVAYISVLPKVAILVFFYHFTSAISNLEPNIIDWRYMISALAVGSMFVGNLSALWQNNAKRMLAYSSIAHSGTLLIGVIVGTSFGFQALIFYSVVYGFMNLAAFYFVDWMEENGIETISGLAGLGVKIPTMGVMITVVLISLVGLPPTGGFTAKLLLFSSLWDTYLATDQSYLLWLFVLGILNSAISLFYYLRIPYYLFLKSRNEDSPVSVTATRVTWMAVVVALVLVTFFASDVLFAMLF
ncbi:NADH-quinone oxidoreductase subunit N [Reichenbachiella agarivorans]|uniref:NADH-quinone oxidoreductase subunit N n=1 Tax=Reichenbachiella agarivorans TaxID=2979464 RepID=A0ABY6CKS0_9BACT|nr:NADH-quinone oxidoreductase subunit N [Reichenbachiella agarivorans]UXP30685.1 NADH-quinone oxidoreductase subunit N [Reichenbachiella agarivorans]